MGHKVSVPVSSLTSEELCELVLELGSTYHEVAANIKNGGLDGSFFSSLEEKDFDELLQDLDGNLRMIYRKNLVHKLKVLLESAPPGPQTATEAPMTGIAVDAKHAAEETNSNVQVPIFIDFGASHRKITLMVDPQSDTVKSLKQKLITLGLGVKLEDIRSLSFGGRVLEDFYALKQYNIEEGTTISVTLEEEKQDLIDGGSTTTSSSSSQSKQVMQPRTNSGKTASAVSSDPKPTSSPANASSKLMSMLKGPRTPTGRANAPCRHHQLRLSNLDHPKIRLFLR